MSFSGNLLLRSAACVAIGGLQAQSPYIPDWQIAAGGKMAFDVASVKPTTGFRLSNFPLTPGDAKPSGGRFSAGMSLPAYIGFAYKVGSTPEQWRVLTHLPESVSKDNYEIEAKAEGNPTKDQMRLMMQSLLADRFKLKVHWETREVPVFALTLVKPGTTGPKLRPHDQGPLCIDSDSPPVLPALKPGDVLPPNCDERGMRRPFNGMQLVGARNTTTSMLAVLIYAYGAWDGGVDRAVVDKTGLTGTFDFTLEFRLKMAGLINLFRLFPASPIQVRRATRRGPHSWRRCASNLG